MKMETKQTILSRLLPKTGQTVEYQAGDDGTYQAGWWRGTKSPNLKTRFISKTIGIDKVTIDRATGLMWAAEWNKAGCNNGAALNWAAGITYANGLTFAGFDDWRLPNVFELFSIADYSLVNPCLDPEFFTASPLPIYWTGTTYIGNIAYAWWIDFTAGYTQQAEKTEPSIVTMRCVRSL